MCVGESETEFCFSSVIVERTISKRVYNRNATGRMNPSTFLDFPLCRFFYFFFLVLPLHPLILATSCSMYLPLTYTFSCSKLLLTLGVYLSHDCLPLSFFSPAEPRTLRLAFLSEQVRGDAERSRSSKRVKGFLLLIPFRKPAPYRQCAPYHRLHYFFVHRLFAVRHPVAPRVSTFSCSASTLRCSLELELYIVASFASAQRWAGEPRVNFILGALWIPWLRKRWGARSCIHPRLRDRN